VVLVEPVVRSEGERVTTGRHAGLDDPVVAVAAGPFAGEQPAVVRPHERDAVDLVVVDWKVGGRDAELGLAPLVREGAHALPMRPVGRVEFEGVRAGRIGAEVDDRSVRTARVAPSENRSVRVPVGVPGRCGAVAADRRAPLGRVAERPLVGPVGIGAPRANSTDSPTLVVLGGPGSCMSAPGPPPV